MAFWCYILRCADGSYYTGHTDNLEVRIGQHMIGGFCGHTSKRRPVTCVWSQEFGTRIEALEAEMRIKPWSRAKKEGLVKGDWAQVSHYAKPPRERPARNWEINPTPFVPSAVEAHSLNVPDPSTSLGTNGSAVMETNERQEQNTKSARAEHSRGTPA